MIEKIVTAFWRIMTKPKACTEIIGISLNMHMNLTLPAIAELDWWISNVLAFKNV